DNYEMFGLFYGLAARRAIERSGDALVSRLAEIKAALDDAEQASDFGQAAVAFHAAVVDAAQSLRIKVVLRAMSALVPGEFFVLVPDAVAVERRGLAAILKAFRRGDGDAAADEYRKMMSRVGEKVAA